MNKVIVNPEVPTGCENSPQCVGSGGHTDFKYQNGRTELESVCIPLRENMKTISFCKVPAKIIYN